LDKGLEKSVGTAEAGMSGKGNQLPVLRQREIISASSFALIRPTGGVERKSFNFGMYAWKLFNNFVLVSNNLTASAGGATLIESATEAEEEPLFLLPFFLPVF
jgi:hypothetical protein